MKTLTLLLSTLFLDVNFVDAQTTTGGKLMAMGPSGVAVNDCWSLPINPAGITGKKVSTIGVAFTKYYFTDELSEQTAVATLPLGKNFLGVSFNRYGINEFNQVSASAGLAKQFGEKLAIGLSGSYHQLKITNYGSASTFSVDIGGLYRVTPTLTLGLALTNPTKQNLRNSQIVAPIPTIASLGLAYQTTKKVLVAIAAIKNFDQKLNASLGIDYQLVELISLRGGISAKPFKQFAGVGINYKNLAADMALQNDSRLGYAPQIALGYAF